MAEERLKLEYVKRSAEVKKEFESKSPEYKELYNTWFMQMAADFILLWDTLKAIEKKCGIDVMNIAREERWKHAYEAGVKIGREYGKRVGIKDLYELYSAKFEGQCDYKWFDLNDERSYLWCTKCPLVPCLKELGKTDEEIKEMAPLFCLADIAIMSGMAPELEIFPQPRTLMGGASHCSYYTHDHGGK